MPRGQGSPAKVCCFKVCRPIRRSPAWPPFSVLRAQRAPQVFETAAVDTECIAANTVWPRISWPQPFQEHKPDHMSLKPGSEESAEDVSYDKRSLDPRLRQRRRNNHQTLPAAASRALTTAGKKENDVLNIPCKGLENIRCLDAAIRQHEVLLLQYAGHMVRYRGQPGFWLIFGTTVTTPLLPASFQPAPAAACMACLKAPPPGLCCWSSSCRCCCRSEASVPVRVEVQAAVQALLDFREMATPN